MKKELDELQASVLKKIEGCKEMQRLKAKHTKLVQQGKLMQAFSVQAEIDRYIRLELEREYDKMRNEDMTIREVEGQLSPEMQHKFRESLDVMSFVIDIIDTCIRNMDEAMRTSIHGSHIMAFDRLSNMRCEIQSLVKCFRHESQEHDELWADTLDSIENYLYMRAAAYHKKAEKITKTQHNGKHKEGNRKPVRRT